MADSYLTIGTVAASWTMMQRVTACAAQQQQDGPEAWAAENRWEWASTPGWAAAWDSALVGHPEEGYDPGTDPAVITDGMILSRVQQMLGIGG